MFIWQNNSSSFCDLWSVYPHILGPIMVSTVGFILGSGLLVSQKVVGYLHDVQVTVVPVGVSCQACYSCNWQYSFLGMIDDDNFFWSLLVACIVFPV